MSKCVTGTLILKFKYIKEMKMIGQKVSLV